MVSVNQVVCTDSLDPVSHAVFSFFFSFLTLWHAGSWFLDRGSNPCLLQVAVWSQPLDLSGPCLSVLGMTRPFQVPKCPPRPLAKRPVGLSKNNSLQSAVLTLSCTLTQCKNRKEGWERAETILLIVLSLFRFWCLSQTCCELGFWSRGPEALRPSPRCSPREICALRKTSVLAGFSGFSRNLQLVMNYDWLWLLSPDVCVASQPLVWLLSDYSFLQGLHLKHWDLRLYLQWKQWFFCSSAPDTLPQTHFYFCGLWLKLKQFLPPDFLCHGHMLGSTFLLFFRRWRSELSALCPVPSTLGVSALEEQPRERADLPAVSWLTPRILSHQTDQLQKTTYFSLTISLSFRVK